MDKKKLKHFKSRLLEEREKASKSLENIGERGEESKKELESELSSYGNHPADMGTGLYMREQEEGFKQKLKNTINEIDNSLKDMEDGKYGYCNNCDKMISEERLEILPYAKTCLGCSDEEINNEEKEYETKKSPKNIEFHRTNTSKKAMEDNLVEDDPSNSTRDNVGIVEKRDDLEIIEEIENVEDRNNLR